MISRPLKLASKRYSSNLKFLKHNLTFYQQFRDRQKNSRQKLINQHRQLEKEATEDIRLRLEEIRANLSKGFDSDHEDYLNVIFKEVEWELCQEELQRQAEEYEQDLNREVDALTRNLEYCIVCRMSEVRGKENKFICENCVKGIFES